MFKLSKLPQEAKTKTVLQHLNPTYIYFLNMCRRMSPEVLKFSKLPQKAETKKWLDVQRLQLNPKLCRHMSPAVFKFPRLPQNAKTPKLVKHPNPTAKPYTVQAHKS